MWITLILLYVSGVSVFGTFFEAMGWPVSQVQIEIRSSWYLLIGFSLFSFGKEWNCVFSWRSLSVLPHHTFPGWGSIRVLECLKLSLGTLFVDHLFPSSVTRPEPQFFCSFLETARQPKGLSKSLGLLPFCLFVFQRIILAIN